MAIVISGTTGITDGDFDYEDEINSKSTKVYVDSKPSGFKNHIINGNFDIWQRGTSQTTVGYGSDDRWANSNNGSAKTHSRQTCTDTERALFNAQYYSRTVVSSVVGTSNDVEKFQLIEDVTKLAGKTVTLSFWARANNAKNIAVEFGQLFGTGGKPSATTTSVGVTMFNLTSIWQKFTKTVTLPSIVGKTIGTDGVHTSSTYVDFWFDAGSALNTRTNSLGQQSGTFDIAQVQLEEGSVATPFENRPYGLELSLCQRYYQSFFNCLVDGGWINGRFAGVLNLKTNMRVTPTFALISTTMIQHIYWFNGDVSFTGTLDVFKINSMEIAIASSAGSSTTTGTGLLKFNATASAEL